MKILLLLILVVSAPVQSPIADTKSACEERAQSVMRTLESGNSLRHALEQGTRRDCIHQPWMDSMRQFGIKQASFLIEYSWKKGEVHFKILNISYLTTYYSNYDKAIKGRKLIEIKKSGLERELREVVLAQVKKGPFSIHHAGQASPDEFEENLLDDEALPALGMIF